MPKSHEVAQMMKKGFNPLTAYGPVCEYGRVNYRSSQMHPHVMCQLFLENWKSIL